MDKLFPYRGVHYNKSKIGNLSDLVTQPYDKITPEMQEIYYQKSPYNIVRLILGKKEENDTETYNQYTRAKEYLVRWINEGILIRDPEPSFYASYQQFELNGKKYTRKGFVCLLSLEEASAYVKAHERTLAGPKADRLNLMRATSSQFEHIFMLYPDPTGKTIDILDSFLQAKKPDYEAIDEYKVNHYLWQIKEPKIITELKQTVEKETFFIADGHHRFETSINYMKEMLPYIHEFESPESPKFRQVTFIPIEQEGLIILPTHRVIHSIKDFNKEKLLENLRKYCTIEEFPSTIGKKIIEELDKRKNKHVFGLFISGDPLCYILTLKSDDYVNELVTNDHSNVWKSLDVTILHGFLEKFLGIDAKTLEAYTNVKYIREPEEGFEMMLKDPSVQAIFFLNPTKVDEVKQVALAGERMPQKSTDFYPKLITGLVMNIMRRKTWWAF
ncbi:MAG: DUF1015 domain-containing protein [candidate division WOR-3 bacterium]